MRNEKKLNKSNKSYTNSVAAYWCASCANCTCHCFCHVEERSATDDSNVSNGIGVTRMSGAVNIDPGRA